MLCGDKVVPMKIVFRYAIFVLLSVLPASAPAMGIETFGKMTQDDQSTYLAALVGGTADQLRAQGKGDQADKAVAFFKDSSKEGGVNQFVLELKYLYGQNKRAITNSRTQGGRLYEVEDALSRVLSDKGIVVTVDSLQQIGRSFTPTGRKLQQAIKPEPATETNQDQPQPPH